MWNDSSEIAIRQLADLRLPGQITRRQTSFWDIAMLRAGHRSSYRIHFRGKREARFADPDFASCSLERSHPLLVDYLAPRDTLSFHGTAQDPARLVRSLEELALRQSDGWRSLTTYLNPQINVLELIKSGSGVLLQGPRPLIRNAKDVLKNEGIEATILEHQPLCPAAQVLLLSRNFVIAEAFRAESLPEGEAA
jgi:hypothetical protein